MKYYISIHDVMPNNLDSIEHIINKINKQYNIKKICLLVVPGLNWKKEQITILKKLQKNGIEIAAHGWIHKANNKKSFYHLIHSLFISKNAAEHLTKSQFSVLKLICQSHKWFIRNNFIKPTLYVPPAWALGNIKLSYLKKLPFNNYECTTGVYIKNKYRFLPLIGFEATSPFRAFFLRIFNFINFQFGKLFGIIRISIHPNDFNLYLSNDIDQYLRHCKHFILLNELD
tara:strand:- start:3141 stop:3827 length:687 start_codon:yes stop_codon:yes gene_type:complete